MPIPVPNSEESQSEFVSRCIKAIYDEYEQSQAAAICYSNWRKKENMKKQEETFVLQPRKNENRGTYLTRCSKHSKMKEQYPNMKERMGFCLNSFNSYYKYWAKLDEFSEKDTEGTALGDCIAKEKAKGFNYKEAYAHCASRVVVKPQGGTNPVVMEEDDIEKDDLLVEPVSFGQAVSIDFDDTLSTKEGQDMAKGLLDKGIELHIVTRRNQDDSGEVYKVADELGIPHDKIHFTNGELKWKTIKALGITKHIDNNQKEIDAIKENVPGVEVVKFSDI